MSLNNNFTSAINDGAGNSNSMGINTGQLVELKQKVKVELENLENEIKNFQNYAFEYVHLFSSHDRSLSAQWSAMSEALSEFSNKMGNYYDQLDNSINNYLSAMRTNTSNYLNKTNSIINDVEELGESTATKRSITDDAVKFDFDNINRNN